MKKYTKAFTLIELLVVISIIGFLSSVVLASLNSARNKAVDAKVISDLKAITTALELFYDEHGFYPGQVPQTGVHFNANYRYKNWFLNTSLGSLIYLFEDTLVAEGYLPPIEEQLLQFGNLLYSVGSGASSLLCDGQPINGYILYFHNGHINGHTMQDLPFYNLYYTFSPSTPVSDFYCYYR